MQTIPGIDLNSACELLVEIGPTPLEVFGSSERLAAWAGLCPGINERGGKRRPTGVRRGNKHLRAALTSCAHSAARTQGCQFQAYHRELSRQRGYKRAIVAAAHKLLRSIYAVWREQKPYRDPNMDYEQLVIKRNAARWLRQLTKYGYLEA